MIWGGHSLAVVTGGMSFASGSDLGGGAFASGIVTGGMSFASGSDWGGSFAIAIPPFQL